MAEPLRVIAAAIVRDRKVLLVSKRAAPSVFYLPGGKPEAWEEPVTTLARELGEELGVELVDCERLTVVNDRAALEHAQMEMDVYLAAVEGAATPQAEIAALAWVGADGAGAPTLAPAIRNHVLPALAARGLIA